MQFAGGKLITHREAKLPFVPLFTQVNLSSLCHCIFHTAFAGEFSSAFGVFATHKMACEGTFIFYLT